MSKWTNAVNKEFEGKTATTVFPYEDWEYEMRPDRAQNNEYWNVIYVCVLGEPADELRENAEKLIAFIKSERRKGTDVTTIAIDQVSTRALQGLIDGLQSTAGLSCAEIESLRRVFLYRPRALAYSREIEAGQGEVINPELVGPALPFMFVNTLAGGQDLPAPIPIQSGNDLPFVGIVDDTIGYLNARFRKPSAVETRIKRLWDQSSPLGRDKNAPVGVGRISTDADINALLGAGDNGQIYEADGYGPDNPLGGVQAHHGPGPFNNHLRFLNRQQRPNTRPRARQFSMSHGTHSLDLAAGADPVNANNCPEILAVELPRFATAQTSGQWLNLFILQAIRQILFWADYVIVSGEEDPKQKPIVINVGYGIQAGPKNGEGFLEREVNRMIEVRNQKGTTTEATETLVVFPAGNSFRDRGRAFDKLHEGQDITADWVLQPDDQSSSYLEIWLRNATEITLQIAPPGGDTLTVDLDRTAVTWSFGATPTTPLLRVYSQYFARAGWRIVVAAAPTHSWDAGVPRARAGHYGVTVTNRSDEVDVSFEVQRDDTPADFDLFGRQSYLDGPGLDGIDKETGRRDAPNDKPFTREMTISDYASAPGEHVFVAGGVYDLKDENYPSALYSAQSRISDPNSPDLAAVTEDSRVLAGVLAASSTSGSVKMLSGTSTAAPKTTRALLKAVASSSGATKSARLNEIGQPWKTKAAAPSRKGQYQLTEDEEHRAGRQKRRPY